MSVDFNIAWRSWSNSLTREDVEGDPKGLTYAAFKAAWLMALGASQTTIGILSDHLKDWHEDEHTGDWEACEEFACLEARFFVSRSLSPS